MSELPKGWVATQIAVIAKVESGVGFPKKYQGLDFVDIPVYKVGDISRSVQNQEKSLVRSSNYVDEKTRIAMKAKIYPEGSTLFAKIGEALKLNRRGFVGKEGIADNNVMGVIPDTQLISAKFLFYFLKTVDFSEFSRSSTVPSIRKGDVENLVLCLAPLAEQKRIVAKLDEVLAQVDTIKARLDRIPATLKRFRQSVLAAAVSGKLTEEWRVIRGFGIPIKSKIKDICESAFDGPFGSKLKSDDYTISGSRVIRLENIGHLNFIEDKRTFVSKEKYDSLEKNHLIEGDILFSSFVDEEVRVTLFPQLSVGAINKADCFCLRIDTDKANNKFICYVLASFPTYQKVVKAVHGATRPRINLRFLKEFEIELPTKGEQDEIVRLVDQYFAFADTIEAQVKKAQARVDNLTQSILAKAFRGELVAQDLNDEPADKLLERIAQARKEAEALAKVAKKTEKQAVKQG